MGELSFGSITTIADVDVELSCAVVVYHSFSVFFLFSTPPLLLTLLSSLPINPYDVAVVIVLIDKLIHLLLHEWIIIQINNHSC